MDFQLLIETVSRFTHVSTAIALVGGSCFMAFVLGPAARQTLTDEAHDQLRVGVVARWKKFVHGGIALFLASGIYNYVNLIPAHKGDKIWHMLVGTKILIALVIFFLASALVGRSKTFDGMRQNRAKWLTVIVILSALVVGMSSFAKVREAHRAVPVASAGQN